MIDDKDFVNDPIFKDLRKFSAKSTGPENMPAEFFQAYREAKVRKIRSKLLIRSLVGIGITAVALPSLSYAHVLPKPIENLVSKVSHIVTAPIRAVASVVSGEPAPTENLISNNPNPSPSENSSENSIPTPQAPAPVSSSTPVIKPSESGKTEHHEGEELSNKSESSNSSHAEVSDGEEGGMAPKIPSGSPSAPTIGTGNNEGKNSGEREKSSNKSED